jgi:hypothetical protein
LRIVVASSLPITIGTSSGARVPRSSSPRRRSPAAAPAAEHAAVGRRDARAARLRPPPCGRWQRLLRIIAYPF